MATLSEWMNRLRYLGRSRFEDDLDVEVRFHIESRTAELIASLDRRSGRRSALRLSHPPAQPRAAHGFVPVERRAVLFVRTRFSLRAARFSAL